jgi:hypothetical protein
MPCSHHDQRVSALNRASSLRRRRARWWQGTSTGALAISVVFGALILTAAYGANERLSLFRFVRASGGGNLSGGATAGENAVRPVGFAELDPGDPTVRFWDTRVGHVLFASSRGDDCRRLLFDNRTGLFYEAKEIFCGQRLDQAVGVMSSDRLTGMQQFFQR